MTDTRFSYRGDPVDDETLPTLPDHLVLKDNHDGALIVRRTTTRFVPVPAPRKDTP